ncbi:uncharacterized protein TrAtP1_005679 [Trichoderma atroviride]|uniref:uncharacterized protein n=1 Tax=Hypocrea atroviridis TaxID=63577 RepID=UPI00332ECAE8|nr:hypothetical protein TrAtP1_005679 [Trichoderma atroviride]
MPLSTPSVIAHLLAAPTLVITSNGVQPTPGRTLNRASVPLKRAHGRPGGAAGQINWRQAVKPLSDSLQRHGAHGAHGMPEWTRRSLVTCQPAFYEPQRHAGRAASWGTAGAPLGQPVCVPLPHCGLAAATAGRPLAGARPGTATR